MSRRIRIDVRSVEPAAGCDLVREALEMLKIGESLHLTLGHPPECVCEAARTRRPTERFRCKHVEEGGRPWKLRVRRIGVPRYRYERAGS